MAQPTPKPKFEFKPPVVAIVGHVDHGKTTLLDFLRSSRLVAKEAGGITQKIGAYQYTRKNQQFTFIDTPGHAAFSKLRQRGVAATDIVILVIAANDGVKPQTVESIELIKAAQTPFVVAINKIDLPHPDLDQIKAELAKHEVLLEDYGGQVPYIKISALKGTGVDQLLDTVWLLSQLEQKPYKPRVVPATGVVIESMLDPRRGATATIIVRQGSFTTGDSLYIPGRAQPVGKIRRAYDDLGQTVELALPSQPIAIIGLNSLPPIGSLLTNRAVAAESAAQTTSKPVKTKPTASSLSSSKTVDPISPATTERPSSESTLSVTDTSLIPPKLSLLIKADSAGSLEAVMANLPADKIDLVDSGVGPVGKADVMSAAATGATIIAFSTAVSSSVIKLAEVEAVTIYSFDIIYKLLEKIDLLLKALTNPALSETIIAQAIVKQLFDYKSFIVVGCQVTSGQLTKKYPVHLKRGDKIIGDSKINSLKIGQQDAAEVSAGQECGLVLTPHLDVKPDDVLVSYKTEK